jgi:hypothetical protein
MTRGLRYSALTLACSRPALFFNMIWEIELIRTDAIKIRV